MVDKSYISILIPTRDNTSDLIACIKSIMALDIPLEKTEIILWDNNSKQECKGELKDFIQTLNKADALKIRLIERYENYGVYTTRDELLKLADKKSGFILSLDDDVMLPAFTLKKLLAHFKDDPGIGIVGPRIIYDDELNETAHGAGFVNRWLALYRTKDKETPVECDYVIGCCMLIKKDVVDEIGGFDRDYYTSHGEIDFCLKAKKKGFKVVYDPTVSVRHRVDRGGTRTLERMYYVYRNKLLVIKKNFPVPQKWTALFIYFLFWFPKAIIDSIIINRRINLGEIQTIFKAMYDGWLNRFGKRT
jgi:GT2 family glycosyltransferase